MLKTRRCYLQKKREEELKQFDENTNWLHRVETEMRLLGQNGDIPKVQKCIPQRHCGFIFKPLQLTKYRNKASNFPQEI